jgi:DNA-binding winged helix-turn-helix (wHTH) protein
MKQFGPYRFDDASRVLFRGGQEQSLTRKARDVLACLLAKHGRWVSKEEILDAVWQGTYVHPDNVKVLVHEVRAALQDDAKDPRFVRSEAGRGYLFVAETVDGDDPPAVDSRPVLVGRSRALAVLGDHFDAARAGDGRVVVVAAERGFGKTALCDHFARLVVTNAMLRATSASCPAEANRDVPLAVFRTALLRVALAQPRLPSHRVAALPAAWRAFLREDRPEDGHLSGDSVVLAEQLPAALTALSHDLPLLITIEDLQHADDVSLAVVAALAERPTPGRWLLLATVCPPEATGIAARLATSEAFGGGNGPAQGLTIGRLTVDDVVRYLDTRFGRDCLPAIAPVVHALGAGSPLLTVAAADGLVESGAVQRHGYEWRCHVEPPVMETLLPELLCPAISGQLAWLSRDELRTLEAASAVGATFTGTQVALALDVDATRVSRALDRLAARRLLIVAEPGTDGQGRDRPYRFRHPVFAHVLAEQAPMIDQIRALQRLAHPGEAQAPVPARSA